MTATTADNHITLIADHVGPGPKTHRRGGHRTLAPSETIARVMPHLTRMGITRVANVTGLDRIGIPVVMVVRPNSRSIAVAQGKGIDLEAAKASGLMESLETWHAEEVRHPLKHGSYEALRSDLALVDIGALAQLKQGWPRARQPLPWVEADNLVDGRHIWVPNELVHCDYSHPMHRGWAGFASSTNGLASGNHLLEAICHAICEVIERDATSLWHHCPQAQREARRIDLNSIDDSACRHLVARYAAAELELAIWNTTSDSGVPSFYCLTAEGQGLPGHIGAGAGCHPARQVALLRALTEAAQTRLTYIAGAREDLALSDYTESVKLERQETVRELMAAPGAQSDFRCLPTHQAKTFHDDLTWLIERLCAMGIEQVLTVDLTRPEIAVPVVRVIIPGLEPLHDDEDFLPGPRAVAAREGRL